MLPNFLIIGAPRAGTTWVAKNLMGHPEIYIPKKKELHYFDQHYDKGSAYYGAFFTGVTSEKAVGEVTPAYLATPEAPERISKDLPSVKLIVTLRNPVDRLYSRYLRGRGNYKENENLSFEEKIRAKPALVEEGFYCDHLLRYYKCFPKQQILVLLYDELERDPAAYLRSIYEYLDVNIAFKSDIIDQQINKATQQKRYAKSRSLWYLAKVLEKMKAGGMAERLRSTLEPALPAMRKETREWLVREVYQEKNKLLQELIGRDLSAWSRIE